MRGNVVELAVAVVIGTAFTGVVNQFNKSFLEPLIKLVTGGKAVSGEWRITDDVSMNWGAFVTVVITFLLTAATVYFLVVAPMNKLNELRARGQAPEPVAPSDEVRLLTEIRDALVSGRAAAPGSDAPIRPERPDR